MKLTSSDPPEDGYEYIGDRKFAVLCNGERLPMCVRLDTDAGLAWVLDVDELGKPKLNVFTQEVMTKQVKGVIEVERIQ